jgi:hypothetical protein
MVRPLPLGHGACRGKIQVKKRRRRRNKKSDSRNFPRTRNPRNPWSKATKCQNLFLFLLWFLGRLK